MAACSMHLAFVKQCFHFYKQSGTFYRTYMEGLIEINNNSLQIL